MFRARVASSILRRSTAELPRAIALDDPVVATLIQSNAGTITFSGGQELFIDSTLLGAAGGSSALGGDLTISSGRFYPPDMATPPTPLDVTMLMTQTGPTMPSVLHPPAQAQSVVLF